MTLKECVSAAVTQAGATPVESFGRYDFTVCSQHETVVFISDCGSIPCGERLSIEGGIYRAVKSKLKLTAFSPSGHNTAKADYALKMLEDIYSSLTLDESFLSTEFTVSEAKASAAHKRILREAYISATRLIFDKEGDEK